MYIKMHITTIPMQRTLCTCIRTYIYRIALHRNIYILYLIVAYCTIS